MRSPDLATALQQHVSPELVLSGASLDRYQIDGLRPSAAILAGSIDDVVSVLRFATDRGVAIAPWGGGTLSDLGNRSSRYDIALDLSRLDSILDYQPADQVVTVQAGITTGELNRQLSLHNQMLTLDPPQPEHATVGGALATNLQGPRRLRYGTARDFVLGCTCALADGSIVHAGGHVVKNVAGYDMNKLYIGALGTTGVIVEVSFRLFPLAAASRGLLATFAGFDAAHALGMAITNGHLGVSAVEILAPSTSERLLRGLVAAGAQQGWRVAVLMEGVEAAIERQADEVARLVEQIGGVSISPLEAIAQDELFRRLRDIGRGEQAPAAMIMRGSVLPSELPSVVGALGTIVAESDVDLVISAGAGSFRLCWPSQPTAPLELIAGLRRLCGQYSGNLVVERCPPEMKDLCEVWGVAGGDVALMRDLKAKFDPNGILNPGRFIGGL